ncbi:hypothetical protein L6452_22101 [Arctium lappa]|uniref:Uncharacterized protein n=1 Tax=Arctium lappa TaxID=4217 RepID=A0ACB9AY01_ARCLA|nr:hypothetical protein L6452_22101 [Arctium lappa]
MVEKGIVPTYTSWELLTWGYSHVNEMNKALECFKKALGSVKMWDFDGKIVEKVYGMVEEYGDVERAEELLAVLHDAGHVNTEIYNLLLRTYAKAGKMPIILAERMKKDNVPLNEETHELIKITSKMCVSEVLIYLSYDAKCGLYRNNLESTGG